MSEEKTIRSAYSGHVRVSKSFPSIGRTKPEYKESCDVNYILKKYKKTGQLPLCVRKPIYGDYSTVPQLQESLNIVLRAQEQFDALPSEVRKRFGNDPANFLEFAGNPSNEEEMVKMGLLARDPVIQEDPVPEPEPEPEA